MTRFLEQKRSIICLYFSKYATDVLVHLISPVRLSSCFLASSAEFTSLKFVFVTSAPPKKSEKYSPLETDSSLYMMYSRGSSQRILFPASHLARLESSQRSICTREQRLSLLVEYKQVHTRTRMDKRSIQPMWSLRSMSSQRAREQRSSRVQIQRIRMQETDS